MCPSSPHAVEVEREGKGRVTCPGEKKAVEGSVKRMMFNICASTCLPVYWRRKSVPYWRYHTGALFCGTNRAPPFNIPHICSIHRQATHPAATCCHLRSARIHLLSSGTSRGTSQTTGTEFPLPQRTRKPSLHPPPLPPSRNTSLPMEQLFGMCPIFNESNSICPPLTFAFHQSLQPLSHGLPI